MFLFYMDFRGTLPAQDTNTGLNEQNVLKTRFAFPFPVHGHTASFSSETAGVAV